jgi:hypothetical protein
MKVTAKPSIQRTMAISIEVIISYINANLSKLLLSNGTTFFSVKICFSLPNKALTLANQLSWFILEGASIIARFSSFTSYLLRPELSIEAE